MIGRLLEQAKQDAANELADTAAVVPLSVAEEVAVAVHPDITGTAEFLKAKLSFSCFDAFPLVGRLTTSTDMTEDGLVTGADVDNTTPGTG